MRTGSASWNRVSWDRWTNGRPCLRRAALALGRRATLGFVFLCVVGNAASAGLAGATCLDWARYMPPAPQETDVPGGALALCVSGNRLYAGGAYSLDVLDVTNPGAPQLLGSWPVGDWTWAVAASGNLVYAGGGSFFAISDCTDPQNPFAYSYVTPPFPPTIFAMALKGNYVFAVGHNFMVIDVSDPYNPQFVFTQPLPYPGYGVVLRGSYAYVAGTYAGLLVFDISNPLAPQQVATVPLAWAAMEVAISGDHAFVAASSRLLAFDISNPAGPVQEGMLELAGSANNITVAGTRAYVGDWSEGVQVVDVTDPQNPALLETVPTPHNCESVCANGGYLYAGDLDYSTYESGHLSVLGIGAGVGPPPNGSLFTGGEARGALPYGNDVFVASGSAGLCRVDVSNPTLPSLTASLDTPGSASGLALLHDGVGQSWIAVADGEPGIAFVNADSPTSIAASFDTPGEALGVAAMGYWVYVAAGSAGLQVLNASSPLYVFWQNSVSMPDGIAHAVAIDPVMARAYVADGPAGLKVISISNPMWSTPSVLGTLDTPGDARGVAVSGTIAYVADLDQGLQIIDTSNPWLPAPLSTVSLPDSAYGVTVSGSHAYVATGRAGLVVIDVADPMNPHILGASATPDRALGVALSSDWVLLASEDTGLRLFPPVCASYSSPTAAGTNVQVQLGPEVTATFDQVTSDGVTSVSLQDSGPQPPGGFEIVPTSPPLYYDMSTTATFTGPVTVCLHYDDANVTGNEAGLRMFHYNSGAWENVTSSLDTLANILCGQSSSLSPFVVMEPAGVNGVPEPGAIAFGLRQPSPNPSGGATSIEFDLPAGGAARVGIYDVTGRRVRMLAEGRFERGRTRLTWDGRDNAGGLVKGGLYFVRLEAAGRELARRVVLVK